MGGGGGLGETVTETDTKIQGRVSHTLLAPISMPFPIYVVAYSKREWPPFSRRPWVLGLLTRTETETATPSPMTPALRRRRCVCVRDAIKMLLITQ